MSKPQLQIGYDPDRRVVAFRFTDDPESARESPPLQPGEGAKGRVKEIVDGLETSGMLAQAGLPKAKLLAMVEAEFRRSGYPWEGTS